MRATIFVTCAVCAVLSGAATANEPVPAVIEATPLAAPAEPAAPLSPAAEEFREELQTALAGAEAQSRTAIVEFYAGRDYQPYWAEEGRAAALEARIDAAADEGLPPKRYRSLLEGESAGAAREAALTRAYLRLALDLASGLLSPSEIDAQVTLSPAALEAAAAMTRLSEAGPEAALAAFAPQTPDYRALVEEKARLEALAQAGGWGERVPDGPTLREGDRDPRVAVLRGRLARLGFSPEQGTPPDPERFDAAVAEALRAFQGEFGLLEDGLLGARTLAAVNASVDDRIGQVLVNLERLRWLGDLGDRYVYVNIPDYTVSVFEGDERVYHTRSVVGTTETQTPEFSETMTYLVVNPTWYIPDSIAKRVYLPKLRTDPGVIARSNMRLFTRSGTEIDPRLVDFSQLEPGAWPFRVRQNPSADNALGRVKFMFPNQFAIYLHDTPAKELFDRDRRAFSNGCVRLEEPFEFAHYLLSPQLDDPEATFAEWVAAGKEHYVTLEEPIRVHITYRTAWVDPQEGAQYRADVYGRDRKVLAALAAAGVSMPGPRG